MAPNLHLGKIIIKTAIAGRYNQAAIWGGGLLRGIRVYKGRWHQSSRLGKIITKTAIAGRYNEAAIWGGGYLGVSECIKEDGTKAHVWARLLQRLQSLVGTTKLLYGGVT